MHPQFLDPEGEEIVFAGALNEKTLKLGLYACANRKCNIYHLPKGFKKEKVFPIEKEKGKDEKKEVVRPNIGELKVISTDEISIAPRVSPNCEQIVYYYSPMQKAHQFAFGLKIYNIKDQSTSIVIPIMRKIDEKQNFAGFYGVVDSLAKFQWFDDSKHVLLSSQLDNEEHFYIVDVQTHELKLISPFGKNIKNLHSILAINKINNNILFTSTNFKNMIELNILTSLNQLLHENSLEECCKDIKIYPLQYFTSVSDLMKQLQSIISTIKETIIKLENSQANGVLYSLENYQTKYLQDLKIKDITENQIITNENKPLIVHIHGGPHSQSGTFTLIRMIYLLKGYNVLLTNYTGTIGQNQIINNIISYGNDFIEDLLGKISIKEFNEITELISLVIKQKLCHPDKIFLMGASNGGYLTGLLVGKENQHGIKFKGGILMNPVLNIPYMANSTDIIDWIYAVCFNKFVENYKFIPEDYAKMYEQSPMNYPSKTPLLLLLGKVDRRVPYHQGLAYSIQCLKNQCEIETFVYPEANHSLNDSINTQYDVMLKCLCFIEKLLEK